jgi:serine/threonine protein kinase
MVHKPRPVRPAGNGNSGSGIIPSRKVLPAKTSLADYFSNHQGKGRVSPLNALKITKRIASFLMERREHLDINPFIISIDVKSGDVELHHGPTHGKKIPIKDPGFLSPEALASFETDARSNIYVLGLILFELLADNPAIDVPAKEWRMDDVMRKQLLVFEEIDRKITTPLLKKLLQKMLAYKDEFRFQTYDELIVNVDGCIRRVGRL